MPDVGSSASGGGLGEQPPTLAADLMLIMLDEWTGTLRVHPRVAGYGLAGALLVDLYLGGHVTLAHQRVMAPAGQPLPGDPVLRVALGWLLTTPERSDLAEWVQSLGASAADWLGAQLERDGWVRQSRRRSTRGGGRGSRLVPVERNRVYWRPCRLATVLAREPTWGDGFLFALLDAIGFAPVVLATAVPAPPPRDRLVALCAALRASHPAVVALAATVSQLASRVTVAPH